MIAPRVPTRRGGVRCAVACALLALAACRSGKAPASEPPPLEPDLAAKGSVDSGARDVTAEREPSEWTGAHETTTRAGHYVIRWRTSIDPVVEGETFSVDAWVSPADAPRTIASDVVLDVDASMPQHGHGMSRLARVTHLPDGRWRAEGLRFHMVGRWMLAFDVTRGARTERAEAAIELE